MAAKNEQSPKEDNSVKKPPAWVFDESTGWIDVNDFLKRTNKLSEEMYKKLKKNEK